jgi:hypothetical protein
MPRKPAKLPGEPSRHLDVAFVGSVRNRRGFRYISPLDGIFQNTHQKQLVRSLQSLICEPKFRLCRRKLRIRCVLSRRSRIHAESGCTASGDPGFPTHQRIVT